MKIALVKSIHGTWAYCPLDALDILGRVLLYSTDGFATQGDAMESARRDASIPDNATFHVVEMEASA